MNGHRASFLTSCAAPHGDPDSLTWVHAVVTLLLVRQVFLTGNTMYASFGEKKP